MGIISDFLNIKHEVDNYIKSTRFPKLHYFRLRKLKKNLFGNLDKLLSANEPLDHDQILELAESLHNLSIGDNYYKDRAKILYYPSTQVYRLTLNDTNFIGTNLNFCEILVSTESNNMEISYEEVDKNNITHIHRINSVKISTNIKELSKSISICNSSLYLLIHDYLFEILSEK